MKHVLHLLDDFLVIDEPSFNAVITMQHLLNVFRKLNVPLALHKSVGSTTCLEYLGIILDSENMITKLPQYNLCRIKDLLYVFLDRRTCTKRELLSLLGHLNYATRVIIHGRSFVSYLLTLAHSVKELHYHVTLNLGYLDDLRMWYEFLDQWNGISFFIDDNFVIAADFDLYTDTSSAIGFGGHFRNKWFQGKWPKLVIDESFSMAYLELCHIVIAAVLWGSDWA